MKTGWPLLVLAPQLMLQLPLMPPPLPPPQGLPSWLAQLKMAPLQMAQRPVLAAPIVLKVHSELRWSRSS
jgi:hypothetical protein